MRFIRPLLILVFVILVAACQPQQTFPEYKVEGKTMGTYYVVKFYSDKEPDLTALQATFDSELELLNDLMSTYRPESELMRFNRQQSSEPFTLSPRTQLVIAEAIRVGHETQGVLDVTVAPLVELWGFGAQGRIEHAPDEQALIAIRQHVGIDKISLNGIELQKSDPRVSVDLSTIAKGYGVDQLAEILLAQGITRFLVDIGGEMRVGAAKPNGDWRVAIEKPIDHERAVQRIMAVNQIAVATSGDYRNYFEEDGIRYSHLIDPRTGKPIQHKTVSSTVLHASAMTADAYATALNVMSASEALAFANQQQLAALIIEKTDAGFVEHISDAFKPYLTQP
ncbi:FAD:protein FMN transferase [Alishewanella sp. 16-MA]|uniref:FAD:protein FMN transferase n=1 Tax=Alishewanella maricola TaxID=2795740 RepID=A0ABS8BZJ2_9ALTE|nr:FAD:protein FMN transferase [Alishewanella maricola]MCB5225486.1 FAD:protein FMN transferase [Alishewanella maricola]